MHQNALFYFINKNVPQVQELVRALGATVVCATNRRGQSYYRIHLSHPELVPIGEGEKMLTPTEHHLSIYESEHRRIPELSQYHYTANVRGSSGCIYKLHVYFNGGEQLAKEPVFRGLGGGAAGPVELDLDEELSALLAAHASTQAKLIMNTLRQQLNKAIEERSERYKTLDLEARTQSMSMADSLEPYIKTLREMTLVLEELIAFTNGNAYRAQHQFLQQMIESLIKEPRVRRAADPKVPTEFVPASECGAGGAGASPAGVCAPKSPVHEPRRKSPVLIKCGTAEIRIHALIAEYEGLKNDDILTYAHALNAILAQIYELSYLASTADEAVTSASLSALQQLHTKVQEAGEQFVHRALFESQFKAVEALVAFHHVLNGKHLAIALAQGNEKLLDFLLTHGDYTVDEHALFIKGVGYNSPLHYCCATHSEASSKLACISVLLKHKASFLAPGSNGLPLAHTILATEGHPLAGLLTVPEYWDSQAFFKGLIAQVQQHLTHESLSTADASSLREKLERYKNRLLYLKGTELESREGHRSKYMIRGYDKLIDEAISGLGQIETERCYLLSLQKAYEQYGKLMLDVMRSVPKERYSEVQTQTMIFCDLHTKYKRLETIHIEKKSLKGKGKEISLRLLQSEEQAIKEQIRRFEAIIATKHESTQTCLAPAGGAGGDPTAVGERTASAAHGLMEMGIFSAASTPPTAPPPAAAPSLRTGSASST